MIHEWNLKAEFVGSTLYGWGALLSKKVLPMAMRSRYVDISTMLFCRLLNHHGSTCGRLTVRQRLSERWVSLLKSTSLEVLFKYNLSLLTPTNGKGGPCYSP